jgi:hypothetical protein
VGWERRRGTACIVSGGRRIYIFLQPDETQKELMRRTASHLASSPNPAQLEMRILANHGTDKRFAFLRGRWSRAWKTAKARIRIEQEEEKRKKERAEKDKTGLGGLTGYGDSEDESDSGEEGQHHSKELVIRQKV